MPNVSQQTFMQRYHGPILLIGKAYNEFVSECEYLMRVPLGSGGNSCTAIGYAEARSGVYYYQAFARSYAVRVWDRPGAHTQRVPGVSPKIFFLVLVAGKAGNEHQKKEILEGLQPSKPPCANHPISFVTKEKRAM